VFCLCFCFFFARCCSFFRFLLRLIFSSLALSLVASYAFGIIQFRDLTSFLRYVSIHPENRKLLLHSTIFPELLSTICESISLFLNNCPEATAKYDIATIYGGGGGKDIESIEYIIESLLQFSFAFNLSESLETEKEHHLSAFQTIRIHSSSHLSTLLNALLTLPTERKLPVAACLMIKTLLNRFELVSSGGFSTNELNLEWNEFQTVLEL
jgi:hypothetical protein